MNAENNIVIHTGFARTGTKGIAAFFRNFGIASYHQHDAVPAFLRISEYKFTKPPAEVMDYVKIKIDRMTRSKQPLFESSWAFGNFFYLFWKHIPYLKILISLRDPLWTCNSLVAMRRQPLQQAAVRFICHYQNILRQVALMKERVYWMDFDKYSEGEYISPLFKLFDIPEEKHDEAMEFLSTKINTSGPYELNDLPDIFNAGRSIIEDIKNGCPELL